MRDGARRGLVALIRAGVAVASGRRSLRGLRQPPRPPRGRAPPPPLPRGTGSGSWRLHHWAREPPVPSAPRHADSRSAWRAWSPPSDIATAQSTVDAAGVAGPAVAVPSRSRTASSARAHAEKIESRCRSAAEDVVGVAS